MHRGQTRFNLAMTDAAQRAAEDADLRVVLLDATGDWDTPEERLAELSDPKLLVRTKCDLGPCTPVRPEGFSARLEVSARTGDGLDRLLDEITARLPEAPPLYPEDYLTSAPLRFLAAEQIREVVFEELEAELPYAVAVEVDEWKESEDAIRLRATLLVERDSQKGIVVGRGGQKLKQLGIESRRRLAERLQREVHLNLWVKTDKNWTKRPRRVRELGYL